MMFCPNCGKGIKDNSKTCVHCGYTLNNEVQKNSTGNTGLKVLFFLISIVGFIYVLIHWNDDNAACHEYLKWSVIGMVVSLILSIICAALSGDSSSYYY